jgi:uncharacterized protein YjbI with pentapeptide repeats
MLRYTYLWGWSRQLSTYLSEQIKIQPEGEMANYNHVKILKQGVAMWNKWRKNHPEVTPDLSSTNLRSAGCLDITDLSGANLREVDLSGTYMFGISLTNANLFGANLADADLSRVDLEGANLTNANLSRADLEGANLRMACLIGANLSHANLACALVTTELRNAHSIEGTNLPDRLPYPTSSYSIYWKERAKELVRTR